MTNPSIESFFTMLDEMSDADRERTREKLHPLPTSEQQAALAAALAAAQGAFKPIIPNRSVKVTLKAGGSYTFRYATLDAVIEATRDALSANGLALVTLLDASSNVMVTQLRHAGGGVMSSSVALPPPAHDWQAYGSSQTYARRYSIAPLLGVAPEYDDDGARGSGHESVPTQADPMAKLWDALDAAGVPDDPAKRREWCERAVGRPLPTADSIRDVDVATMLEIATGKKPLPPPMAPKATDEQAKALNQALERLAPWGTRFDGMDPKAASAGKKNAKLSWASGMLGSRVTTFREIDAADIARLTAAAQNGEVPKEDGMPEWMSEKGPLDA